MDGHPVASVTVTYNPDLPVLEAQLRGLPEGCFRIIVDNASRPEIFSAIEVLAAQFPRTRVIRNECNIGLAAAVNRGVEATVGLRASPRFALLLDQDSEPMAGSVDKLVDTFLGLERSGYRVGAVGPALLDPSTGLAHGFHQCTRWRWKRARPAPGSDQQVECANLNGSGTLVPIGLLVGLGGLDEDMFIDHVDTEWSFRLMTAGYTLWGVPSAVFWHRMGSTSMRFWLFGWHLWPSRVPQRHYYLFRNAVSLMRRDYVPNVWKAWAVVKLAATVVIQSLYDPARRQQWQCMYKGIRDGLGLKLPSRAPGTGRPHE